MNSKNTLYSQNSFTGGIIAPQLARRADLAKYSQSVFDSNNLRVTQYGTLSLEQAWVMVEVLERVDDIDPVLISVNGAYSHNMLLVGADYTRQYEYNIDTQTITSNGMRFVESATADLCVIGATPRIIQIADVLYISDNKRGNFIKLLRYDRGDDGIYWKVEPVTYTHPPYLSLRHGHIPFYHVGTTLTGDIVYYDYSGQRHPDAGWLGYRLHNPIELEVFYESYQVFETEFQDIPTWIGEEDYSIGDKVRVNGIVYEAKNAANSGVNMPVHEQGIWSAGKNRTQWEFKHAQYGILQRYRGETYRNSNNDDITINPDWAQRYYVVDGIMPDSVLKQLGGARFTRNNWGRIETYRVKDYEVYQPIIFGLHQGRMVLASQDCDALHFSATDDYVNFKRHLGRVQPDDAMLLQLVSYGAGNQLQKIMHVVSLQSVLIVLCEQGEFVISDNGNGLAPDSFHVKQVGTTGCSRDVLPLVIDNAVFFAGQERQTLYSLRYHMTKGQNAGYWQEENVGLFSGDILKNRIKKIVYQPHPRSVLWVLTDASELLGLTLYESQKIFAWHKHTPFVAGIDCDRIIDIGVEHNATHDMWMIMCDKEKTYVIKQTDEAITRHASIDFLPPHFEGKTLPLYMVYRYHKVKIRLKCDAQCEIAITASETEKTTCLASPQWQIIEMTVNDNFDTIQDLKLAIKTAGHFDIAQIDFSIQIGG